MQKSLLNKPMGQDLLLNWMALRVRQMHQMGYPNISVSDIEEYFNEFAWRKQKPAVELTCIGQIMALTPNQLYDYKTLQIQKQKSLSLDQIDLTNLD